jgi:hypothetical protein
VSRQAEAIHQRLKPIGVQVWRAPGDDDPVQALIHSGPLNGSHTQAFAGSLHSLHVGHGAVTDLQQDVAE